MRADGDSSVAPVGVAISEVLANESPIALLLDFTRSGYVTGDGICGVVLASKLPACVVARGQTAVNVERTLRITGMLSFLGARLFEKESEALDYLRSELKRSD